MRESLATAPFLWTLSLDHFRETYCVSDEDVLLILCRFYLCEFATAAKTSTSGTFPAEQD